MSRAARSLFFFGIYVFLAGVALVAVPMPLMSLLRLPPAAAGWVRIVGLLCLVIGSYDTIGARAECMPYIRSSVLVRFGFAAGTALLFAFGEMPVSVLILGASDIAGAVWTAVVLKASPSAAAQ